MLMFAQPEPYSGAMWGPLLEKGWAKISGNYELADGGYIQNGLKLVTGAPVYTYWSALYQYAKDDADLIWSIFSEADDANYIMAATTEFT
jgi:hypothetical protein